MWDNPPGIEGGREKKIKNSAKQINKCKKNVK